MLGEFLLRLAVALPLVCGLAVASLFAVKRGWLPMPAMPGRSALAKMPSAEMPGQLRVLAVKSLSPGARIAVIRFAGRDHLIGVSGQGIVLLTDAAGPQSPGNDPASEVTA